MNFNYTVLSGRNCSRGTKDCWNSFGNFSAPCCSQYACDLNEVKTLPMDPSAHYNDYLDGNQRWKKTRLNCYERCDSKTSYPVLKRMLFNLISQLTFHIIFTPSKFP